MLKYQGVKTLEVLEGADNYNFWISSKISPYIESPALEIGAGTGNISAYFKNLQNLVLTDIDLTLANELKQKFKENKNVKVETLDIEKPQGAGRNRFNSIYLINVLEHIKNDEKALQNIHNLLKNNGRVALLVPAKKFAFTTLDRRLGHYRRYEKEELRKKLEEANFKIEKLEYFNILGLLSWLIRDLISNDSHLTPKQVKIFDSIVPFLRRIEPNRRLPIGISLIAVGRKV